jgi:hypothetical protein
LYSLQRGTKENKQKNGFDDGEGGKKEKKVT